MQVLRVECDEDVADLWFEEWYCGSFKVGNDVLDCIRQQLEVETKENLGKVVWLLIKAGQQLCLHLGIAKSRSGDAILDEEQFNQGAQEINKALWIINRLDNMLHSPKLEQLAQSIGPFNFDDQSDHLQNMA